MQSLDYLQPDMDNVTSKPSAARVIFFGSGKFLVWTYAYFFVENGKNIPGYVTLPSHGNFTQTDVVYPAWVWLPKQGKVTQAG